MKTKITISSHINFYKKTYPILVDSLLNAGVPSEDIYFFINIESCNITAVSQNLVFK